MCFMAEKQAELCLHWGIGVCSVTICLLGREEESCDMCFSIGIERDAQSYCVVLLMTDLIHHRVRERQVHTIDVSHWNT